MFPENLGRNFFEQNQRDKLSTKRIVCRLLEMGAITHTHPWRTRELQSTLYRLWRSEPLIHTRFCRTH